LLASEWSGSVERFPTDLEVLASACGYADLRRTVEALFPAARTDARAAVLRARGLTGDGVDLALVARVAAEGRRVPYAAQALVEVARGLAAAWEVGLVHRDVKPGNVLLTKTGIAKVTDLGLAVRVGSETDPPPVNQPTGVGSPVGTCGYISPEQCVNDPTLDFRSDIYSLGATFYHAVTGRLPFVSRSTRQLLLLHMNEPVIPPHKVAPGVVDEETSAVICRMMEKNPADRYESYDELIADLIPLSQGGYAGGSTNTPGMGNLTPANVRHKTYR
jgi:hypothetical protein